MQKILTFLVASLVTASCLSPSLILRDSDTESENVSLIQLSVPDGQMKFKGCIIDRCIINNPLFG